MILFNPHSTPDLASRNILSSLIINSAILYKNYSYRTLHSNLNKACEVINLCSATFSFKIQKFNETTLTTINIPLYYDSKFISYNDSLQDLNKNQNAIKIYNKFKNVAKEDMSFEDLLSHCESSIILCLRESLNSTLVSIIKDLLNEANGFTIIEHNLLIYTTRAPCINCSIILETNMRKIHKGLVSVYNDYNIPCLANKLVTVASYSMAKERTSVTKNELNKEVVIQKNYQKYKTDQNMDNLRLTNPINVMNTETLQEVENRIMTNK